MADLATGTWTLESSDNFAEYMKAVGVGPVMRKIAVSLKAQSEIKVDGNTWTIKTISWFRTTKITFLLGEEFDQTTADGRDVKTTMTLNGNTLTAIERGDPDSTITREFANDTMNLACTLFKG